MRLAYLFVFLASLVFNALALETIIFKYDNSGDYISESLGTDSCDCYNNYYRQSFDF
jgi:hypothetical protein